MNADYIWLLASVALVCFGLLIGDGTMAALTRKGWLLKIMERMGIETEEEELIADKMRLRRVCSEQ